jgi:tetratricopeptide (TPR) repeat protein
VSAVARVLAELYLSLGLTRHAEAAYLNLLNLSREEGDRESGMLAHVSLARIYGVLGNKKLILEHLDAALFSANEIGDQQTAGQAKRMMAEMR